jgi:glutamate-ammonia-ligase adenylyltransferase
MDNTSDAETALQDLNYFKQMISLRVAVALLKSTMSAFEASSALSQLAQSLVQAVLTLSQLEMESRHGQLPGPGLTVIAYGSLGAGALGFDSDLDLIFLYQPIAATSDGARPLPAERYHTNVARRMLSLMSAITPSGRLYSIDARLRPNGRSGLLVSSVDAFNRYQMEEAWVWELQALTRARPVAGDKQTAAVFDTIRKDVLTTLRDKALIETEVRAMRERIRKEYGDKNPLKHGHGGLLDIEFVIQLGLLLNAATCPDVITSTEAGCQLLALCECGWLGNDAFKTMDSAYTQLSHVRLQSALVDDGYGLEYTFLLDMTQALCDEILG